MVLFVVSLRKGVTVSSNVLRVYRSRKAKNLFVAPKYLKERIKKNDETFIHRSPEEGDTGRN